MIYKVFRFFFILILCVLCDIVVIINVVSANEIELSCDHFYSDLNSNRMSFFGNVEIRIRNSSQIFANRVDIQYRDKETDETDTSIVDTVKKGQGEDIQTGDRGVSNIKKIDFTGNIRIITEDNQVIQSDSAYYEDGNKIYLHGNVSLKSDTVILKGSNMSYNIESEEVQILSDQAQRVNIFINK